MDITIVREMVQELRNLHDTVGAFIDEMGLDPYSDSLAVRELHSFARTESVRTAYGQGIALIEVAADHLIAFIKTVTEPVQTIAPWAIVRGILEASSIAAWLHDPSIDTQDRVSRSLAFRYEGLNQQRKFARSLGNFKEANAIAERIQQIEELSLQLGYRRVADRKGRRIGIGRLMPSITDLVSSELDEEPTYRLLSAVVHGHPWALQQVGFRKAHSDFPVLEKHISLESVVYLCVIAARVFVRPMWFRAKLFGWDINKLRLILNSGFDKLGIVNENYRIWDNSDKQHAHR